MPSRESERLKLRFDCAQGHLVSHLHVRCAEGDQQRGAQAAQFVCGASDDAARVRGLSQPRRNSSLTERRSDGSTTGSGLC